MNLTVKRFILSLSEPAVLLFPGDPAQTVTVTITRSVGFTSSIDLSLEGLPFATPGAGIGHSFNPDPTTGSTSTLSLQAGRFADPADLFLTVRGTGGGVSETAPLSVEVFDIGLP